MICSGTHTTCQISCYNNACDDLRLVYDTDSTNSSNNNYCNNCEFSIDCGYLSNITIISNGNIYMSGSLNIEDIMLIDGKNSDSGELFCNGARVGPALVVDIK